MSEFKQINEKQITCPPAVWAEAQTECQEYKQDRISTTTFTVVHIESRNTFHFKKTSEELFLQRVATATESELLDKANKVARSRQSEALRATQELETIKRKQQIQAELLAEDALLAQEELDRHTKDLKERTDQEKQNALLAEKRRAEIAERTATNEKLAAEKRVKELTETAEKAKAAAEEAKQKLAKSGVPSANAKIDIKLADAKANNTGNAAKASKP